MTIRKLTGSVALIALIAGTPLLAQTAPQAESAAPRAEAAASPQTAASQGDATPALIAGLGLTDLETDTKDDGERKYEGRLSDGTEIEARFDMSGNLIKVESDDGPLPQSLIDQVVPQAARDNQAMALFARIDEIKMHPRGIRVEGHQTSGDDIEVEFGSDNTLTRIEADDTAIPQALIDAMLPQAVRDNEIMAQFARIEEIHADMDRFHVKGQDSSGEGMRSEMDEAGNVLRFRRYGDEGRHGDREHGRDRGHDRGPRGDHRGDWGRDSHSPRDAGPRDAGPREGGPRDGGSRGDMATPPPPEVSATAFDTVAAQKRLTDAGYTSLGLLRVRGPGAVLDATNPQNEAVLLELSPEGEVIRETAR